MNTPKLLGVIASSIVNEKLLVPWNSDKSPTAVPLTNNVFTSTTSVNPMNC